MSELSVVYRTPGELHPYQRNARKHSRRQISQIAASIKRFGFTNPILIDDADRILAGHGRLEAAKAIGMPAVPTIRLSEMTDADRRAYVIADNRLALNAGWDYEILAGELQALIDLGFDVEVTGFSVAEVDLTIEQASKADPKSKADAGDHIPLTKGPAATRPGDVWQLGRHRLLCGDARDRKAFCDVMGEERADLLFSDPPYNVPVVGHVTRLGLHPDFSMAVGEMSSPAFTAFLETTLGNAAAHCRDGAIAYVFMDWRHMGELLEAGHKVFHELKNLCVWNKSNAGMGSFYRSKHELVFVFKVGEGPHIKQFRVGGNWTPSRQRLGLRGRQRRHR